MNIATTNMMSETCSILLNFLNKSSVVWIKFSDDEDLSAIYISENIKFLGYEQNEFLNGKLNLKSIIHKEDFEKLQSELSNNKQSYLESFNSEFRVFSANNKSYWIEAIISPIFDGDNFIEYQAVLIDITQRKQDQILKDVVYKISNVVNQTKNLVALLNFIKEILNDFIDTKNFFVALYHKEKDTLTLPFFVDEIDKFTEFPARKTLTSYIIKNDICLLADVKKLDELEESGDIELVGSPSKVWLGVPLKIASEIIGALVTQSYEDENLYNEYHLEIMKFVSEQIAIAIQRQNSEDILKQSEEKYRLIVENSPLGILLFDKKGVVTATNNAHSRIIGASKEEMIGFDMMNQLNDSKIKELILEALNGNATSYEGDYIATLTNKKSIIKLETVPIKDSNDDVIGGISIIEDISERKQAENALKESEQKLSSIFNNAIAGICILDLNGKYKYFNSHFAEMLGYERQEMKDFGYLDITFSEDVEKSIEGFNRILNKKEQRARLEKRYVRKDGTVFWVDLSVAALLNDNGEVESITNIIVDITNNKATEQKNHEINQKLVEINATKDKFFSIISHDLRNNLGSFRNVTQLLLESYEHFSNDEMKESLSLINSTSKRVYNLLENLLEWSRSQTGRIPFNPEPFNLYLTVNNIVGLMKTNAKEKNIDLISEVPEFSYVYADVNMINTVLRNLVTNAIKFTPSNGRITLTSTHFEDKVIVCVKDKGVGIPEQVISKLFRIDENHTTMGTANEQGSGLGLILCKEFIEKNNGKIWAESTIGEGSTFSFSLPFYEND